MKKIVYTSPSGEFCVLSPCEGSRLAHQITLPDDSVMTAEAPIPVDQFLRRWQIAGAVADWAETEGDWLARIQSKDVPAGSSDVRIVDESFIPADRTFRAAWVAHPESVCAVDMDRAREIHRNTLRALRAPKLAALDVEFMRALESGNNARMEEIAAEKAALRDVTSDPGLISASTPEELKAVVPEILK